MVDNVLEEDITLGVDVGRNIVIFKASCAKDSGGGNGHWTAVKVAVVRGGAGPIEGVVNL